MKVWRIGVGLCDRTVNIHVDGKNALHAARRARARVDKVLAIPHNEVQSLTVTFVHEMEGVTKLA